MNGPTDATSNTVSSEIISENQDRKGLVVRNLSEQKVFLAFGKKAVLNKGKVLYPDEEFCMGKFSFSWESVTAISDGASLLAVQEF